MLTPILGTRRDNLTLMKREENRFLSAALSTHTLVSVTRPSHSKRRTLCRWFPGTGGHRLSPTRLKTNFRSLASYGTPPVDALCTLFQSSYLCKIRDPSRQFVKPACCIQTMAIGHRVVVSLVALAPDPLAVPRHVARQASASITQQHT